MNTIQTLTPRFLAGFGTLALLAGVGLFASRPAHTAGGPIPVSVANTVQNHDADNPALQPFTVNISIHIPAGQDQGTDNGSTVGTQAFSIPAGKRLVAQTVSMYRSSSSPVGSTVQVFVNTNVGSKYSAYSLPAVPLTGAFFPGTTQALTFQADGGSLGVVNGFRNGTAGDDYDTVTVSGYLVNIP